MPNHESNAYESRVPVPSEMPGFIAADPALAEAYQRGIDKANDMLNNSDGYKIPTQRDLNPPAPLQAETPAIVNSSPKVEIGSAARKDVDLASMQSTISLPPVGGDPGRSLAGRQHGAEMGIADINAMSSNPRIPRE